MNNSIECKSADSQAKQPHKDLLSAYSSPTLVVLSQLDKTAGGGFPAIRESSTSSYGSGILNGTLS